MQYKPHSQVKDKGASNAGAIPKKSAQPKPHQLHQQRRWVPPTKTQMNNASPTAADNASKPNRTTLGSYHSNDRYNPKSNTWQSRRHK